MTGERLGAYRIDTQIGAGGMGAVFRAYDTQLQRPVAIKFLSGDLGDGGREQLLREARAASALNHPNVCTIHHIDSAEGRTFIVMELVDGESLSKTIPPDGMPADEVLRLGAQIAEALAHAHDQGVVHRDLKSANIMITRDGRVKVLDFGLARRVVTAGPEEVTGALTGRVDEPGISGTLAYLPPEVLRGQAAGARGDIWALGVVLYEMLTGRLPFTGATTFEVTAAVLEGSPPPLGESVPAPLQHIVLRCLEKDPAHRYQRAGEVRSALDAAATPAPPRPVTSSTPLGGRLTLAALVIAVAGMVVALATDAGGFRQRLTGLFSDDVIAFAERDWLLVADFENHTADDLFDRSLNTALAVGLGQSRYVNLVPQSRIAGGLQRMKRSPRDPLDAETAQELAQREGIRLVLVPAISEVGGVYQLSASFVDPATGLVVGSESARAAGKDDVLVAIDEIARGIRDELGEAREATSQSKPLVDVTTSSLEALRVFSSGREAQMAARIDEARALFERALEIDPSFTAARASLGMLHFELIDRPRGLELLTQAMTEVEGLTEKERYSVLAFHAAAVERNPEKAIGYYQALLALYPDVAAAHNNIGRGYLQMRRYPEAIAAFNEALRLDPDLMLTYNSLNQIYLYQLGDLDAAIATVTRQLRYNDRTHWAYDHLGWALLGKGDLANAREAFEKALELNPRMTLDVFRLGHTYRLEGRYAEARATFLRVLEIDQREDSAHYDAGVVSRLMGDERTARRDFQTFRERVEARVRAAPGDAGPHFELAAVLSRLGEHEQAWAAARKGLALDPARHFEYALFLSLEGRVAEALDRLERAVAEGFRNLVWLKIHADLEPVSSEPRFKALLEASLKPR